MIKVSVIIPVYNAGKYLDQMLKSVVDQTLKDIEIICINDGSTDDSLAILEKYASLDDRIRVISKENEGAARSRNIGLMQAKGEYLSFLDADDFFDADMLEKAYDKAIEGDADLVVWRSDRYIEDRDSFERVDWTLRMSELPPYRPMYYRTFTDNVFKVFVGWAWDKLFRRSFILEHDLKFQEIRTSNDMLFVFSAIVLSKRIEVIDEVLCHQRKNDSGSLSNTRERSWNCFHEALIALRENLLRFGLYDELEQDYINYALHFSLWHLDTITGEKRKTLHDALRDEWFKDFGISDKSDDYFYNRDEYKKYRTIMSGTYKL